MSRRVISFFSLVIFVLFLCPATQSIAASSIPSGAKEYNGNYYYLYQQSTTWENAKLNCEAVGGHLVTITSIEEQEFIESLLSSDRETIWIGGYCSSKKWKWITGEEWIFTNWNSINGYPNEITDGQSIFLTYNFEWAHGNKDFRGTYICEWEGNDVAISLPNKVKLSSIKKASSSSINITWKEDKYAKGYSIYMKIGKDGEYKKVTDIDSGDVTTYNISDLKSGTTYYFRVRAYKTIFDEKSYGELSGEKKITLK